MALDWLGGLITVGSNAVNSFVNGAISNFYNKKSESRQQENNLALMQQQQAYTQQNMADANAMNRQNIVDSLSLEKQARHKAGLTTAGLGSDGMTTPVGVSNQQGAGASAGLSHASTDSGPGLADSLVKLAQAKLFDSQAQGQDNVNSRYNDVVDSTIREKDANIQQLMSMSRYNDQQKEHIAQIMNQDAQKFPALMKGLGLSNDELTAKIDSIMQDVNLKKQMFDFNVSKLPLDLKLCSAQIYELYTRGNLNNKNAQVALANVALINAEAESISWDSDYKAATFFDRCQGLDLSNEGQVTLNSLNKTSERLNGVLAGRYSPQNAVERRKLSTDEELDRQKRLLPWVHAFIGGVNAMANTAGQFSRYHSINPNSGTTGNTPVVPVFEAPSGPLYY